MASVILKWFGPRIYAEIKNEEKKRMELATRHLRNAVIRRIGIKFPPASKPGEPPHLRTGNLRNSIATEVVEEGERIVGRVGTNTRYARFLELPEYLNRSFLMSTLEIEHEQVHKILSEKLPH